MAPPDKRRQGTEKGQRGVPSGHTRDLEGSGSMADNGLEVSAGKWRSRAPKGGR